MKLALIIFSLCFCLHLQAQKVINVRYPANLPELTIYNGYSIPAVEAGYTLWLPKGRKAKGMIVFAYENRDSIQQDLLIKSAMTNGLAVIFLTTENPIEFLFEDKKLASLAQDLSSACKNFQIPTQNLLFAGHSIAGFRALKLAIFAKQNPAYKHLIPRAIAISDVPLDMNRYYNRCDEHKLMEISGFADVENISMMKYLSDHLDGSPSNSKARYTSYSPYSRTVRNGGNAGYFQDIYIRAYIDTSVNWTSEQHGGNAYDMANFIYQLHLLGSKKATLVQADPPRNAKTSWDIVDERNLVEWFARMCTDQ